MRRDNAAASTSTVSLDDAIRLYYDEFRAVAHQAMANERRNHTLQPTELVHDLVRELQEQGRVSFHDRHHAFAYFRRAFAHMLADHARIRNARKRGRGWTRVSMSELANTASPELEDSADLHRALSELRTVYPRVADVMLLRYFFGYHEGEIGAQLGCSERTVRNDCRFGHAWLRRALALRVPG